MIAWICVFLFILLPSAFANEVGLLTNRREAELRREQLILSETKELSISTFILDLDEHGKRMIGLAVDAASRGVTVKLNVDGLIRGLPGQVTYLKAVELAGVDVRIFNPIVRNAASLNYRNHMKGLIGKESNTMISGGRNITQEYYQRKSGHNYIDVDVLTKGSEVEAARAHFDEVFYSASMKKPWDIVDPNKLREAVAEVEKWKQAAINSPKKMKIKEVQAVQSLKYKADPPGGPAIKAEKGIHKEIFAMIDRATKSLDIMNPYVFPTDELLEKLKAARARGVKIRLSSNSAATTNSAKLGIAWDVKKEILIDLGIDVYELTGDQFLHAKTIVRDGVEVYVGSFNLDPRSQNLNLENGFFIEDSKIAAKLKRFNDSIVRKFMVSSEKAKPISELPFKERPGACLKRTLHKAITEALYPLL